MNQHRASANFPFDATLSTNSSPVFFPDIRIPLLWRDGPLGVNMQIFLQRLIPQSQSLLVTASLLAGSGDSADRSDTGEQCDGYAVFCLARLGHTIRETRLIFDIQPGTSDVEFDDKLTL